MNWLGSRVRLRLRTLLEIVDLGFIFVMANRKIYQRLGASILVASFGACAVARAFGSSWAATWILALVLGKLVEGVFTVAAGRLLFTENVPVRDVLEPWWKRLGSYLATSLLTSLLVAVGAVTIAAFPIMIAKVLFAPEFCLLEAASPSECTSRGGRLIKGQSGRIFVLGLLLAATQLVFVIFGEILGQGLVATVLQLDHPFGGLFDEGGSLYAVAGFFLAIPYVTAMRFIGYIDVRTRREGWDVQVRFAALLQSAAAKAAA